MQSLSLIIFFIVLSESFSFLQTCAVKRRINKEIQLNAGPCPNAEKCSGQYLSKGCDGMGKIQGGIATVSLMSWWPIKVYRPCPAYLEAGYVYRREGQTLDQVLFSEPSTKMKEKMEALRIENEAKETSIEPEEKSQTAKQEEDMSPEEKFLNDRFGR